MNETKIGLLRVVNKSQRNWPRVTRGKLYPVVSTSDDGYVMSVLDDEGVQHRVGRTDLKRFWKQCWLLPDGTAVEVLE